MVLQHEPPDVPVTTSLIEVHVVGMNVVLQPLVMASPPQALTVVSMLPTLVESQYTSHAPWQLAEDE